MSIDNYPNRDAMRDANDIYLDVMRPYITHHLKQIKGENVEDLIEESLNPDQLDMFLQMLENNDDIESAIDFNYIPQIIKRHWNIIFGQKLKWNLVVQSMLWLIRDGRNSSEHRGSSDLDVELTRSHLFLISSVLEKINRNDKQSEIDDLRDELLSCETKRQILEISDKLATVETEKKKYKKHLSESEARIKELEKEQSENKEHIDKLSKLEEEKEQLEKENSKLLKDLKIQKKLGVHPIRV